MAQDVASDVQKEELLDYGVRLIGNLCTAPKTLVLRTEMTNHRLSRPLVMAARQPMAVPSAVCELGGSRK